MDYSVSVIANMDYKWIDANYVFHQVYYEHIFNSPFIKYINDITTNVGVMG